MNHFVKAGGEGLIWVVVGIFWVVAQIAGAAAKKNPRRPPLSDSDDQSNTPVDPFTELLRKMSGEQEFRIEPPEFTEEPDEKPVLISQNRWKQSDIEALPDIEPLTRAPAIPEAIIKPEIAAIDIRPTLRSFRNTLPAMKLPAMTLRFHPLEKKGRNVTNLAPVINPADKKTLRRAMLSHIVFSKPKAFEP